MGIELFFQNMHFAGFTFHFVRHEEKFSHNEENFIFRKKLYFAYILFLAMYSFKKYIRTCTVFQVLIILNYILY